MALTILSDTAEKNATAERMFPPTVASTATGPFPATSSSVARIAKEPFVLVSAGSDDKGGPKGGSAQ